MHHDQWSLLFRQYRTRGEIRRVLLGEMRLLVQSHKGTTAFPAEISQLPTDSDQDVIDSFDKLQKFCNGMKGPARTSVVGAIGVELRELFSTALERMNQIPPESAGFRRPKTA